MVRPDETRKRRARARQGLDSCWTSLRGASPLPVSVGAPGSRSRADGEIHLSQAGFQKLVTQGDLGSGEQARGPQHKVKLAASSDSQSTSRAAHFTVKAKFCAPVPKRAWSCGGVGRVARVQRDVRNRRGPSGQPLSRQGDPYKPKVKAESVQRESEGNIVPR